MRGQSGVADAKGLAVAQGGGARDQPYRRDAAELWVALADPTLRQHLNAPRAGRHLRPAEPLQLSDAPAVSKMHVRVNNEFHVLNPEPEGANVGDNLRNRLGEGAVDEDVPGLGGKQDGSQTARPHVVRVAVDAEGLLRPVPLRAVGAGRSRGDTLPRREHRKDEQRGG